MSTPPVTSTALYTFGLLDPDAAPARLSDFARRGGEIMAASDAAPGFLGRAGQDADAGWGPYALPDLPSFTGHDREVHIATLSLWRDVESARAFVYDGLHRDALRRRRDWFLQGTWPGYVLWDVVDAVAPHWSDGVARYEALARDGESPDRFTFGPRRLSPGAQGSALT